LRRRLRDNRLPMSTSQTERVTGSVLQRRYCGVKGTEVRRWRDSHDVIEGRICSVRWLNSQRGLSGGQLVQSRDPIRPST
jgi:hypothetical protein